MRRLLTKLTPTDRKPERGAATCSQLCTARTFHFRGDIAPRSGASNKAASCRPAQRPAALCVRRKANGDAHADSIPVVGPEGAGHREAEEEAEEGAGSMRNGTAPETKVVGAPRPERKHSGQPVTGAAVE